MTIDDQLFALWAKPPDTLGDPVAAFSALYTDPVLINGSPTPIEDLVARARGLHAAFDQHEIEVVERVESPGRLAIAFRHRARHVGPWPTPLGTLEPTNRVVSGLSIDVYTFTGDRIGAIWVLADELQRILQVRS